MNDPYMANALGAQPRRKLTDPEQPMLHDFAGKSLDVTREYFAGFIAKPRQRETQPSDNYGTQRQ